MKETQALESSTFVHWPTLYANVSPMNLSFLICKVDRIFSCHDRMRYIPTQGLMQQVVHKCELLQLVLLHPNMCPSNFKIPHFDNVTSSTWRLERFIGKGHSLLLCLSFHNRTIDVATRSKLTNCLPSATLWHVWCCSCGFFPLRIQIYSHL